MRHPSKGAMIRPAERDRGCIFKDDFRSQANMVASGYTLYNTPTFDVRGMILNGTTQYGSIPIQREFSSASLTFHLEFYPDFEADDGASHDLMDTTPSLEYRVSKNVGNALLVFCGGTTIINSALATYQAYWITGGRNVISVSAVSGANTLWLNGTQIVTNALGWTPSAVTDLDVGRRSNNTYYFPGTISRYYIGHHTSDLAEHTAVYNNTMWSWENRAVVDLQFRTADYDPSTVEGADVITDGNMEAAGTAAYTAFRGAVLTKEGDPHSGTQCLRVTADGVQTIPYASQAALITGEWYYIEGWTRSDGFTQPRVVVGGTVLYLGTTSATWQPYTALFEATATTVLLQSMLATGYADHDDITITHMIPRTLDSSGNGNHATLGDGLGANEPTQGAGRMVGDAADYLQIPADVSIPAGTYTVLTAIKPDITSSLFLWDARNTGGAGYLWIDGSGEYAFASGSLYVDGAGPWATSTFLAVDRITTLALVGVTIDVATLWVILAGQAFTTGVAGTIFDFKVVPGTLNLTQILDYHSNVMRKMGAEV